MIKSPRVGWKSREKKKKKARDCVNCREKKKKRKKNLDYNRSELDSIAAARYFNGASSPSGETGRYAFEVIKNTNPTRRELF